MSSNARVQLQRSLGFTHMDSDGRPSGADSGLRGEVGGVEVQDPPAGIFVPKDDCAAPESLRITELKRDEDESGIQRLDAEVCRNQTLVRRSADRVCADIGEDGTERGVDPTTAGNPFGHVGRRMEDSG